MITEIILSPVKDEKMNSDIKNSLIWKNAYKPEEVTDEIRRKYNAWYEYHVRFEGLKPIQMTKFKEI
jgi:hypothetical protein